MSDTNTDIAAALHVLSAAAAAGQTSQRAVEDAVAQLGGLLGLVVLRPVATRTEWAVVMHGKEISDPVSETTARGWMRYPWHTALLRRPVRVGSWEVLQEQGVGVGSAFDGIQGEASDAEL